MVQNLIGIFHERRWIKSVENIATSPFEKDLSNDIIFSQNKLAGQSLQVGTLKPILGE
jgi:hypothetical protein